MKHRGERWRYALTPAGAGVMSLFLPGVVLAAVSGQMLLLAVSIGAGLALMSNVIVARYYGRQLTVSARGPVSATVDEPFSVELAVGGGRRMECVLAVDDAAQETIAVSVPAEGDVWMRLPRRGLVRQLNVGLVTALPLGLASCTRMCRVDLAQPISVAPRPVGTALPEQSTEGGMKKSGGGEPVGVRPYLAGDPRRNVHWPTVARTGTMMVMDRGGEEAVGRVGVVVDSRLAREQSAELAESVGSAESDDLDDLLGRARSILEQLLDRGYDVDLTTVEELSDGNGPPAAEHGTPPPGRRRVVGRVGTRDELVRRLALVAVDDNGSGSGFGDRAVSAAGAATLLVGQREVRWLSSN